MHADRADEGSRAEKQRKQRMQQIVAAAKEVFAERGYHEASINDIIKRAGIARGTFYLYFESKHKIFDAILDETLEQLRARIARIDVGAGALPPQQQLRGSIVRVLEYMLSDRDLIRLLFSHGLALDVEVAERIDGFYAHVHALMSRSLTVGIEIGLVRSCNTELVAYALMGAIRGVLESAVRQDAPLSNEVMADELIAFVLRGVVTPQFAALVA